MHFAAFIQTSHGTFLAEYTEKGLARLHFPGQHRSKAQTAKAPEAKEVRRWHQCATQAVKAILRGDAPDPLPPLDLSAGSGFRQKVWRRLRRIPPGRPMSYSKLAAAIGHPKAARAVGGACGANPIPLLIPCHRVVAADGSLGGFSAGLDWKRRLLGIEGRVPA